MKKLLLIFLLLLPLPVSAQVKIHSTRVTSGGGGGLTGPNGTSLLDNFQRADNSGPPSANWSADILETNNLKISSNAAVSAGGANTGGGDYWNVGTFGPQSECWLTYGGGAATDLVADCYVRVSNPSSTSITGYYGRADNRAAGVLSIWRVDNSTTFTQLTTVAVFLNPGDSYGISASGSTLTIWYKASAGNWVNEGTITDATYSSAGYLLLRSISVTAGGNTQITAFGGGTY